MPGRVPRVGDQNPVTTRTGIAGWIARAAREPGSWEFRRVSAVSRHDGPGGAPGSSAAGTGREHPACPAGQAAPDPREGEGSVGQVQRPSFRGAPIVVECRWISESTPFLEGLEDVPASARFDAASQRLELKRDPLGERALYYAVSPQRAAFASSMTALRESGAVTDLEIDPAAVDAYLAFGYIPTPLTIFRQIRRVRAGHAVTIDLRALARGPGNEASRGAPAAAVPIEERRCWALPERDGIAASPATMLDRIRAALARRTQGAARLGVFLSGGLDSSVVAALAAETAGTLASFSMAFGEERYDESSRSRRMARRLGSEHHEIRLDGVDAGLFGKIVAAMDEPFADPAAVPTWLLARASAEAGCATPLTGDGADALLAGDHWFRRVRRMDRLAALPRAARGAVVAFAALGGAREARRTADLARWAGLPPAEGYLAMRQKWSAEERRSIFEPSFAASIEAPWTAESYRAAPVRWRPGRLFEGAVALDTLHNLPDGLLMKVERMGRVHGVACRSPFLDREFVDWTARLDPRHLLRGRSGKDLLRRAAADLLPREIAFGRKQGLSVPTDAWLRGPLREVLEASFSPALVARQGIFRPQAMKRLKERFEGGRGDASAVSGQVWQIVVFQAWWLSLLG
jgi:asparagine synthase (glutamine-hydrolysing)